MGRIVLQNPYTWVPWPAGWRQPARAGKSHRRLKDVIIEKTWHWLRSFRLYQRSGLPLTRPLRNRLATSSKLLAWKRPAVPAFAGNIVALDCLGDCLETASLGHRTTSGKWASCLRAASQVVGSRINPVGRANCSVSVPPGVRLSSTSRAGQPPFIWSRDRLFRTCELFRFYFTFVAAGGGLLIGWATRAGGLDPPRSARKG